MFFLEYNFECHDAKFVPQQDMMTHCKDTKRVGFIHKPVKTISSDTIASIKCFPFSGIKSAVTT